MSVVWKHIHRLLENKEGRRSFLDSDVPHANLTHQHQKVKKKENKNKEG
jgi:hypothetical protein